jgi:hypothetical protein
VNQIQQELRAVLRQQVRLLQAIEVQSIRIVDRSDFLERCIQLGQVRVTILLMLGELRVELCEELGQQVGCIGPRGCPIVCQDLLSSLVDVNLNSILAFEYYISLTFDFLSDLLTLNSDLFPEERL